MSTCVSAFRPTATSHSQRVALLIGFLFVAPLLLSQGAPSDLPHVELGTKHELIYSSDPADSWNRIFYYLFSRKLSVRLAVDFPEGAPFIDSPVGVNLSTRVFERNETGDLAVDPMYPTFSVGFGSMLVLSDSTYDPFTRALRDALKETDQRSVVARAIMQSDLWGAYDALFYPFLPDDEKKLGERRKVALDFIGRLIRKVALTADEIGALPDNYSLAVRSSAFPDVFGNNSGWMEIAWFLPHAHDDEARYRRMVRVLVKPAHPPHDVRKFLEAQSNVPEDPSAFDGLALITQLFLIDSRGNLRPTRLTTEAQFRIFNSGSGTLKTTMRAGEISRKLLLEQPETGGLKTEDDNTPAYLSNGGSYGFAEGHFGSSQPAITEPIQVKLRTRCALCHGENLKQIMTFSIVRAPHSPHVRQLSPASTEVADVDSSNKRKQKEFQALLQYFKGQRP